MATVTRTIFVDAAPTEVWDVIANVEAWPRWATYMQSIHIEHPPLREGARVRVKPKALPSAVWAVTEYVPPRSFTWIAQLVPGVSMIGGHVVEPVREGTNVTLSLAAEGTLAVLLRPVLSIVFRRNTRVATAGLKDYVEQRL